VGAATVIILHPWPPAAAGPLTAVLVEARDRLVAHHTKLFRRAGAAGVRIMREPATSFGSALRGLAAEVGAVPPAPAGLVVLGAGAVPLLGLADARRLVAVAASGERRALTNNRYSSDVCAVGDARVLRGLPALPGDNALPRWLVERAGVPVAELPGRDRLALDLDTPLDLAVLALARSTRPDLRRLASTAHLQVPRLAEVRAVLADPRRELLVFGRASSRGLAFLERHGRCRVRFLAEERGLRASSALARRPVPHGPARPPRATLGRLLEARGGPDALATTVAELADGAILDSRVLLADRLGADEARWPSPEDRYASDLLRPEEVRDPWLRALTASAARAGIPILLGGHTLVGPGLAVLAGGRRAPLEAGGPARGHGGPR
jgi:CTP:molybdopterin cytidylyltransferase MocA